MKNNNEINESVYYCPICKSIILKKGKYTHITTKKHLSRAINTLVFQGNFIIPINNWDCP